MLSLVTIQETKRKDDKTNDNSNVISICVKMRKNNKSQQNVLNAAKKLKW